MASKDDPIAVDDSRAFGALVVRYQGPMFGFLGRMGLAQAEAEEIAQETFLRAWVNMAQYRPDRAGIATWLFTIARNLALNHHAKAASGRETAYGDDIPEIACERPLASDALAAQEGRVRLRSAIRRLAAADRTVLALVYVADLAHADVARIEGCSVGAVKTRLHRAREKLRHLLMEDGDG